MTSPCDAYCAALGIRVPRLEDARPSSDANYYSLLLVALLEQGEPMTLAEAALRFEEAGVAPAQEALASLKRCKPARAPRLLAVRLKTVNALLAASAARSDWIAGFCAASRGLADNPPTTQMNVATLTCRVFMAAPRSFAALGGFSPRLTFES